MQTTKTYRIGWALCAESVIFGYVRWYLGGLEEHLPDVFVRHAEEFFQRLVFDQVELPQIANPSLTRKDPAEEHNLDYVDELDFLAYHIPDAGLKSGQLFR